jgi:excisionase family DNA binding protein
MEQNSNIGPFLLDKHELAELLGVSVPTISLWTYGRRIPFFRLGKGPRARVRFNPDEVRTWLDKSRVAPINLNGEGR